MISICMATFNGESIVKRQLDSIMCQIGPNDEIIIVDDKSTDSTVDVISSVLKTNRCRYKILTNNQNVGPISSFEKALQFANGDYIYLSDQDDEWFSNKITTCQHAFIDQGADLIVHDAVVVNKNMITLDSSWNHFNHNRTNQTIIGNLIKNSFTGSMMAFTKEIKNIALPFPKKIAMHDQWLFLVAKISHKKILLIKEPLMSYVRHDNNVTGNKRKIRVMLVDRVNTATDLLAFWHRKVSLLKQ